MSDTQMVQFTVDQAFLDANPTSTAAVGDVIEREETAEETAVREKAEADKAEEDAKAAEVAAQTAADEAAAAEVAAQQEQDTEAATEVAPGDRHPLA